MKPIILCVIALLFSSCAGFNASVSIDPKGDISVTGTGKLPDNK